MRNADATDLALGRTTLSGPGCTVVVNAPRKTGRLAFALVLSIGVFVTLSVTGRHRVDVDRGFSRDSERQSKHTADGIEFSHGRRGSSPVSVVDGLIPTADELIQSWVYRGAARIEGVERAIRDVQAAGRGGAVDGGSDVNTNTGTPGGAVGDSGGAGTESRLLGKRGHATGDLFSEPRGAVLSSSRHTAWVGDCVPFIRALNASEGRADNVGPVEYRPSPSSTLARQAGAIVSAAMAAIAVGRPFRAAVGNAFGKPYIRTNLFNWRVHRDHYDLVREKRPHVVFGSVRELLLSGGGLNVDGSLPRADGVDDNKIVSSQTLLLDQSETPPAELLPALTRRLKQYGQLWPVEMDQAVMCTTLALMRPSFAVVLRIEELLEAAADEQGVGLLVGIVAPPPPSSPPQQLGYNITLNERLSKSLECAWHMSQGFVREGGTGGAAWIVMTESESESERGIDWAKAAAAYASHFVANARSAATTDESVKVTVLSLADVIAPVGVDDATFRAWVGYFSLMEVHACTESRTALGVLGCQASLRRYHASQGRMQSHRNLKCDSATYVKEKLQNSAVNHSADSTREEGELEDET